jgi:hypothetical protein
MGRAAGTACAVLLGLAALPAVSLAQTDYRNLDDGRPVRTEDAFVVDHHEFEFLAPFTYDAGVGGSRRYVVQPELEYGIWPNTQLSIKVPFGALDSAGSSSFGTGGLQVSEIYNFNHEGPSLPALSARVDLLVPAGTLAYDDALVTLKAIASRTFGLTRLHLNAAWTFGTSPTAAPALEAPPRWFVGAAVDYTLFRSSILLAGDLTAAQDHSGAPTSVVVGAGMRWQWTPTLVLDAGVARRLTGNAGPDLELTAGLSHAFAVRALMPHPPAEMPPPTSAAAGSSRAEEFYYPGQFNWRFLSGYPEAARLFNAFDYGHATLYETLLTTEPGRLSAALEREYLYLTTDLLRRPPRFGVAEVAIEPEYARIAWQAKLMFDWAHVLHRQVYDVYADQALPPAAKDSLIEVLTDYYLSRRAYAFTAVPKSMELMDGQAFSQEFRRREPRFNGLIWAYHWLQVSLYEPFVMNAEPAGQAAGVAATVAHFWAMLDEGGQVPRVMPMTATVAPRFSRRHPRAAVIFDNLHMMHDIISDILIADTLSRQEKGRIIGQQLAEFRDPTRNVMSMDEWWAMGDMMGGVEMMGGQAGQQPQETKK